MNECIHDEEWFVELHDYCPVCEMEAELAALRAHMEELERVEQALYDLFQACSNLCLDDMNKLEAEINQAAAALAAKGAG